MRRLGKLLAVAFLLSPSGASAREERPNFVFIMSDDQGWGDVGYRGHEILKTPELDAMAAAGMRLERFYSGSPVCSPTRVSCLTGRHAYRTGVWRARDKRSFRNEEVTLAEVLRDSGYRTGFFGKWHFKSPLGDDDPQAIRYDEGVLANRTPWSPPLHEDHVVTPWDKGFEQSFANFHVVPTYDPLYTPDYPDRRYIAPRLPGDLYGKPYFYQAGGEPYRVHREGLRGPNPRVIADRAVDFLEEVACGGAPFLCVVWFHTPHRPVVAGPEHRALYPDLSEDEQHWYGSISAMDEQIGRLRDTLRRVGAAENTVVWFCSDNGPAGCDGIRCYGTTGGLRGAKGTLWEGGVRVPGIVEWPTKITAGAVSEIPMCTSDYLPTCLRLAGVDDADLIHPIDGLDMSEALFDRLERRPQPICFRHMDDYAVVDNRFKLRGRDGRPPELYDLRLDSSESGSLADEHPQELRRLLAIHEAWDRSWRRSLARLDYKTPPEDDLSGE